MKIHLIFLQWPLIILTLVPNIIDGRTILGIPIAPPVIDVTIEPQLFLGCCYGDQHYAHQEVVLTQPKVCLRLVCNNGTIEPEYLGEPGHTNCCEFDGLLYASGSQLPLQCFQFFCRRGVWITDGTIEDCCKHCHLYNDPHFVTFDQYPYDWFGTCNYSITQTGLSYYPNIGVFSDFIPCNGLASCLSRTTFRDNPNTIITLDSGMIFNIQINGELQTVPSPGVHQVVSSSGVHPVLVWKAGACTALVGSSKISVLHCPDRLDIWTHPTHSGDLYGLCGHFNSYQDDDFTNRNGVVDPLTPYPLAFPTSWVTLDQSDPGCHTPCPTCLTPGAKADPPCKADTTLRARYLERCRIALQKYSVSGSALSYHIESCAVDICLMYQNGEDDEDVEDWLRKVGEILLISQFIETKKLGDPCDKPCTKILLPVCGTDGKTYSNRCLLDIANCKNPCIEFSHGGECKRTCPIQICTLEYNPICANNGITYGNPCALAAAQCQDPCIRFRHNGECENAQCNRACAEVYQPVCGSGRTYPNRCELDNAICINPCIEFKNEGPCSSECPRVFCTKELRPVCGTDGVTYSNLCLLEQAQCNDPCIKLSHEGSCGRGFGVDGRASFENSVEDVRFVEEPQTTRALSAEACECIRKRRPQVKQAVKDFDFLHWLMNDVYAKAALASANFGRPRLSENASGERLEINPRLAFWSKLKDSLNVAFEAIKDIQDIWKRERSAGKPEAANGTSVYTPRAVNATDHCPQSELDATFKLLTDNFNEVIHVRADLDNGVVPPFVVTEIVDNMPLAIAALMETEANFKALIEQLNASC